MTTPPIISTAGPATGAELTCAPAAAGPALGSHDADRLATVLKALADPSRLRMLALVAAAGEACVCDLGAVVDVAQPTVSHHLKVLRDAGVVTAERRGTWVHYRLAPGAAALVRSVLDTMPTERTP